jgi:hypothetical protein
MSDLQQIELLLQQIKELSQDPSVKARRTISSNFAMISSLAQTLQIVYSMKK